MNTIKLFFIFLLSTGSMAGSLFSFETHDVQMAALNWVQAQDSDLAGQELEFDHIQADLKKGGGDLTTSVFFKYKDENPGNKIGHLYVCVKLDEDGKLKAYNRDILPKQISFGLITPNVHTCQDQQS